MCKYCEEMKIHSNRSIVYADKDCCNIIRESEADVFIIQYYYKNENNRPWYISIPITHCPWCGRKLEVLEGKPEPAPSKDDFDLLLAQVQKIEARLDRVCTNLYCVVEKRWWDEDNN